MAARPGTDRPPPSVPPYIPPQISVHDNILASRISLSSNPAIAYVFLKPATPCSLDPIEQARRSILSRYASSPIQESILTCVHIGNDPFIFLFKLVQQPSPPDAFAHLDFDGLVVQEASTFTPPSISSLVPDYDKIILISHFYDAVRSRLIHDIVNASSKKTGSVQRYIKRLKNGFLMSQNASPSGWEYKAITRPLVFCQLQVHFSYTQDGTPSYLVIHPTLIPTPFLDIFQSLPLPAGTPITLLPYGTPAYFLASYTGPTAGLIKQFNAALQGLGAGDWDHVSSESSHSPTFIVGWIKVENKQGEDKGLTIIYPTKLCLSYLPFSSSRVYLDYIPDLPAPLQPSPPASKFVSASIQSVVRQPSFITSPTSESLYSFRALTLASKDLKQVTAEVGGYIDAVARERERERERLRREREFGATTSPKTTRSSMTPATTAVTSVDQSTSTPAPAPSQPIPSQAPQLIPTPTSLPTGVQTFYPSPPQTDPSFASSSEVKTSPIIPSNSPLPVLDVPSNTVPTTETIAPTATQPSDDTSFHSYDMDSTWSQPADGFLGMDINNMDFVMDDMGLNFSLHMGPMANDSTTGPPMTPFNSGGNAANITAGMEFEGAFTDDDFSFFDQPSKPSAPQQLQHIHNRSNNGSRTTTLNSRTVSTLSSRISPPNIGDVHHQHSASTSQKTPGGLMDGFSPRSLTDQTDSLPPELIPSSPGQTAESQSIPATPDVHLELDTFVKRCISSSGCLPGASLFEPIPFAPYHRQADGKYAFGKFALPTPPAEDIEFSPEVSSISLPASPSGFTLRSWRVKYDAATDPRIGVVKKLIGVKRKLSSIATIWDNPQKKANITQHHWEGRREDEDAKCEESDPDSEEDGEDVEDNDSMNISRPTTPPPSYLPLGPTLLNTHFHHSHLLPLSVPLRPPGAAIDSLNLASNIYNPPLSVPTPVSPAATMGAASEKSRSLEAAALAIATEVVENPVWAEAWRANAVGAKSVGAVWSTDIRTIKELMQHVPGLEAPLSMAELFGLTNTVHVDSSVTGAKESNTTTALQLLEVPMLSIGKGEAIIQVLPPALRFWEKLGLTPKGGRKDVTVFALFEDDGRRQSLMENWLKSVKNAYQGKHYGSITFGNLPSCSSDGLISLRFDATFRKTLGNLVSSLTTPRRTTVVFLVLPIAIMTLSSPVLRQILSVSKKVLGNYPANQILFKLIPEQHITIGLQKSSAYDSALDLLSSSVYNRILIPVDRLRSRCITNFNSGKDDTRSYLMAPSFTLARSLYNKVSLVRASHTSLDVMDRYSLLHVGYHSTACGKWIIVCCIDQRGESHNLGVWLTQSPGEHEGESEHSNEEYAVKRVWDFAMQFTKKTNVEWRVVFAKLGVLTIKEMEAWNTHFNVNVAASQEQPPLHHSLVCVVPDVPWLFTPSKPSLPTPVRSLQSTKHAVVFTDVSSTTYAIFPNTHLPISIPPSQGDLGLSQSHIVEPSTSHSSATPSAYSESIHHTLEVSQQTSILTSPSNMSHSETHNHPVSLLPHSTSILIRVVHPHSTSSITTSMTHIHLLRTCHSASYLQAVQSQAAHMSQVPAEKQLLADLTRNYYELSVLSKARWNLDGLGGHKGLPFHLAATDAVRMALDKNWEKFEGGSEL